MYFEEIERLLSSLKDVGLEDLDLLRVQSIYMRREEDFLKALANKSNNYKKNDCQTNKDLLLSLQAEMNDLLKDRKALTEIVSKYN